MPPARLESSLPPLPFNWSSYHLSGSISPSICALILTGLSVMGAMSGIFIFVVGDPARSLLTSSGAGSGGRASAGSETSGSGKTMLVSPGAMVKSSLRMSIISSSIGSGFSSSGRCGLSSGRGSGALIEGGSSSSGLRATTRSASLPSSPWMRRIWKPGMTQSKQKNPIIKQIVAPTLAPKNTANMWRCPGSWKLFLRAFSSGRCAECMFSY